MFISNGTRKINVKMLHLLKLMVARNVMVNRAEVNIKNHFSL